MVSVVAAMVVNKSDTVTLVNNFRAAGVAPFPKKNKPIMRPFSTFDFKHILPHIAAPSCPAALALLLDVLSPPSHAPDAVGETQGSRRGVPRVNGAVEMNPRVT